MNIRSGKSAVTAGWVKGEKSHSEQAISINNPSIRSRQIQQSIVAIAVDALVFEFMGLAMLALCLLVLAIPSRRRPVRHIGDS